MLVFFFPITFTISRITGLAASLGYGAASEILRRTTSSSDNGQPSSLLLTEANVRRLVAKLTQMRGAALKMGQFLSIQGQFLKVDAMGLSRYKIE